MNKKLVFLRIWKKIYVWKLSHYLSSKSLYTIYLLFRFSFGLTKDNPHIIVNNDNQTHIEWVSLNNTIPQITPDIVTIYPVFAAKTAPALLIKYTKNVYANALINPNANKDHSIIENGKTILVKESDSKITGVKIIMLIKEAPSDKDTGCISWGFFNSIYKFSNV